MKKSIIVVVILIGLIALLPIVGNSFMKQTIDTRVKQLELYGLEISADTSNATYLSSSRHFEFLLKDSDAFMEYLNQFSSNQIPPYVNAMLNGVVIGVDIEYSNLPFAKAVEIELYPLSFSKDLKNSISKNDLRFSQYIENFLASKGILYHISYNLLNSDFKGYVKDIKTEYEFDKSFKIDLALRGATFKGSGILLAPDSLTSNIKSLKVNVHNEERKLHMVFDDFSSKNKFKSKNSYKTSFKVKNLEMYLLGTATDVNITMDDLKVDASSNDEKEKVALESKVSFKEFQINATDFFVNMKKFDLKIEIDDLDKQKYKLFHKIASKNDLTNSAKYQKEMQNALLELIEKGVILNIKKLRVKEMTLDKSGKLGGFKISSKVIIKEDPSLTQKVRLSPLLAMQDLELHSNVKLSKKMYAYMLRNRGMLSQLNTYAKEDGDDIIFDFHFVDSKIRINDKKIN